MWAHSFIFWKFKLKLHQIEIVKTMLKHRTLKFIKRVGKPEFEPEPEIRSGTRFLPFEEGGGGLNQEHEFQVT